MKIFLALLLESLVLHHSWSEMVLEEYSKDELNHDLHLLAFDPDQGLKIVRSNNVF